MIDENKIIIEGRVGSHYIKMDDDGYWSGQFDLHSRLDNDHVGVLDCRADERMMSVHNLGVGISGHRVRVEGRFATSALPCFAGSWHVAVQKISILD